MGKQQRLGEAGSSVQVSQAAGHPAADVRETLLKLNCVLLFPVAFSPLCFLNKQNPGGANKQQEQGLRCTKVLSTLTLGGV